MSATARSVPNHMGDNKAFRHLVSGALSHEQAEAMRSDANHINRQARDIEQQTNTLEKATQQAAEQHQRWTRQEQRHAVRYQQRVDRNRQRVARFRQIKDHNTPLEDPHLKVADDLGGLRRRVDTLDGKRDQLEWEARQPERRYDRALMSHHVHAQQGADAHEQKLALEQPWCDKQ